MICRLLHKSLSQKENTPPFLDNLRRQLATLRQTLLKRVDKRMISISATTNDLIESLSAFCLANSSSLEDAVRHCHRVRQEAMRLRLTRENATHDTIVQSLDLYIRTLQRTAELLSGRLADALGKLTVKPIMNDPAIQQMGDLGLDVLHGWIPDDIKNFTPWIKHNYLTKQEADKVMRQWSKTTFERLCSDSQNVLSRSNEFSGLISLRKQLLNLCLPVQYSTPSHSTLEVLQGIRDLINQQLVSILRFQSEGLASLAKDISYSITSWSEAKDRHTVRSLWEPDIAFLDFSDGAGALKGEIVNRMLGKSEDVLRILEKYQAWISSVDERKSMIAELKRDKWGDVADDYEEEELEGVDEMLSDDDPHLLQKEHETSLTNAFATLQASLNDALSKLEGEFRASQAAFILRLTREIRRGILPESPQEGKQLFAQDLIPTLYNILATETVSQLQFHALTRSLTKRTSTCPGRTLWEGDPPLPAQPSPMAFKFLQRLTTIMTQQGPDIWNVDAVNEVKTQLVEHLVSNVRETLANITASERDEKTETPKPSTEEGLEDSDDKQAEGEAGNASSSTRSSSLSKLDAQRGNKIQLLFDLLYLNQAFALRGASQRDDRDEFTDVTTTLETELEFSDEVKKTLATRAQEYWTRTQLLFGLLG